MDSDTTIKHAHPPVSWLVARGLGLAAVVVGFASHRLAAEEPRGIETAKAKVVAGELAPYAEAAAMFVYHEPNLFTMLKTAEATRLAKGWDGKPGDVILIKLTFLDPGKTIHAELGQPEGFRAFHERLLRIQRGALMNLVRNKILKPEDLGEVGFAYYVNGQFYVLSRFERNAAEEQYRMKTDYGAALKYIAVRYGR